MLLDLVGDAEVDLVTVAVTDTLLEADLVLDPEAVADQVNDALALDEGEPVGLLDRVFVTVPVGLTDTDLETVLVTVTVLEADLVLEPEAVADHVNDALALEDGEPDTDLD